MNFTMEMNLDDVLVFVRMKMMDPNRYKSLKADGRFSTLANELIGSSSRED